MTLTKLSDTILSPEISTRDIVKRMFPFIESRLSENHRDNIVNSTCISTLNLLRKYAFENKTIKSNEIWRLHSISKLLFFKLQRSKSFTDQYIVDSCVQFQKFLCSNDGVYSLDRSYLLFAIGSLCVSDTIDEYQARLDSVLSYEEQNA